MASTILVPDLGESVVEATVLRWLKNAGDPVAAGEPVVELETEKVNVTVSAPRAGVLTRIDHNTGDDVSVGEQLGVIEPAPVSESQPAPEPTPVASAPNGDNGTRADAPPPAPPAPLPAAPPALTASPDASDIKATPVAKRLADEYQVDLRAVTPGAADGRITKQDVENYRAQLQTPPTQASVETSRQDVSPTAAPPSAPAPLPSPVSAPSAREERIRMSRRRQTIARRLVEAQQTAAILTTFNEVDMTAVMEIRARHKESFMQRNGVKLGLTSFFVQASVGALKQFPQLNAEIQGDEIVLKHYYDIGIAVASSEGLVVPVLRDADRLSFADIERQVGEFAQKASKGTLTLEDLRGGTFTLTNGGTFGSLLSTPILNPPQVAILGLHKIEDRPVALNGQVIIRPMMYVAVSYDHRLVDGREAVQFLVRIKELIQDPTSLLLDG